MSSLEVNKAAAAVLTAGVAFWTAWFIGTVLVKPHPLEHAAISLGVAPPAATIAPAAPVLEPVGPLLASANVANGLQIAQRQCSACHSFNEGGRSGVGPNLYGIMGAAHGHVEGFNYSASLKAKPGPWDYEGMNAWLAKPATYAPGTRMAFAGINSVQQRADVIAYLRSLAATPIPLPDPAAAAPAAPPPAATPAAAATPSPAPGGLAALLANADVAAGERLARQQCAICHSFNEGGNNGVGPNIYNIIGQPHAHSATFNYSTAFRGKPGTWTYEDMDDWLRSPLTYAPGTRMAFIGIANPQQRANVIAWLRTLSANPVPLPAP